MADRVVGGDGAFLPVGIGPFWVLTEIPDQYVAAALTAIEQRFNPERTPDEIRWVTVA